MVRSGPGPGSVGSTAVRLLRNDHEHGADGNRRNAPIDPRERATAVVPLTRVGEAQDIANGVLFLCTDAANYMTGQELVIDGGMTAGGRPSQRSS